MYDKIASRTVRILPLIVLVAIALFQMVQTRTIHLTPWKGGGFGMFSTIEGPQTRFLHIYLLTDTGEIPVEVPEHLERVRDQVRYMPHRGTLTALADALEQQQWVPGAYTPFASSDESNPDSLDQSSPDSADSAPQDQTAQPRYRALMPNEPPPSADQTLKLRGIRIELWRFTFDTQQQHVNAGKWLELTRNR